MTGDLFVRDGEMFVEGSEGVVVSMGAPRSDYLAETIDMPGIWISPSMEPESTGTPRGELRFRNRSGLR